MNSALIVRRLGRVDYEPTWHAMQAFTAGRRPDTPDELWLLEHPPVFTLGQAGRREHVLADVGIPVVPIDRGGQVTYHGPGQVVIYVLLDLRRRGYGVKALVDRLEQAVIDLLADYGVTGARLAGAPGVYVDRGGASAPRQPTPLQGQGVCMQRMAKIAALGLRIRNGCAYHGLALNVDMDLAPYAAINPCGYAGMAVTQLRDLGVFLEPRAVGDALAERLQAIL